MPTSADRFIVRYWGVRGSIPTPGPTTVRYGGNTTCLEVRCGDELIIIDAGSGLRVLGQSLMKQGGPVSGTFLFSHLHWDHIQGFPFFIPAFTPGNQFHCWSEQRLEGSLLDVLQGQMAQPAFPVNLGAMQARFEFHDIPEGGSFQVGDALIRTAPLNHPGGATAFRIDYRGKSFVQATDHEHADEIYEPLRQLAHGADYLSYDSMYTNEEYSGASGPSHVGWGHSTWQEACRAAEAAEVNHLVLFHHDPDHTDDQLDHIGREAVKLFSNTLVAYEGMVLDLLDE